MKIRITKPGIFGATGEIPVGAEFTVKAVPAGWAGRYEEVVPEPAKNANPVTGDKPKIERAEKDEKTDKKD